MDKLQQAPSFRNSTLARQKVHNPHFNSLKYFVLEQIIYSLIYGIILLCVFTLSLTTLADVASGPAAHPAPSTISQSSFHSPRTTPETVSPASGVSQVALLTVGDN